MAQIGYGYGSEFQLLRFLGHHRDELNASISKQIGLTNNNLHWLDFGYCSQDKSITGDREIVGLGFLKGRISDEIYSQLDFACKSLSWDINAWQNWDAVFEHDGTFYFVEAKAHVSEMRQSRKNGGTHSEDILSFMEKEMKDFSIVNPNWVGNYYQLANRLTSMAMLQNHGIKAKAVYIFFENGFIKKELGLRNTILSIDESQNATKEEYLAAISVEEKELGIFGNSKVSKLLCSPVFVDANPHL